MRSVKYVKRTLSKPSASYRDPTKNLRDARDAANRRITAEVCGSMRSRGVRFRLHAVEGIASGEHGGGDGGELDAGDVAGGIGVDSLADIDAGGQHVGPEVGGRAGEDAVEVGGEALGFHERFAPAIGAAIEIGMLRGLAVEGLNEVLGVHSGEVQGAIAEVVHLFRMMVGPARVLAVGFVSGVGASGGVA